MKKIYREMLDVIRAEVAELYRLRRADAERLSRLEQTARRERASRRRESGIAGRRAGIGETDGPQL